MQDIMKYMYMIRTAQKRFGGNGWRLYDEQFRHRLSLDPNRCWAIIDNDLWLLYMQMQTPMQVNVD